MPPVTKPIKQELRAFAERITPPNQNGRAVAAGPPLTAEQLQEKFGLTTDRHGQPLKPGQLYLAKDAPAVNQLRRLCAAYERGGWAAVECYLQPYRISPAPAGPQPPTV